MSAAEDFLRTRELHGKKSAMPTAPGKRYYDCRCVRCGMNYMTDMHPSRIEGALDEHGGFLYKNCRVKREDKKEKFIPLPLQLSLFDTKK